MSEDEWVTVPSGRQVPVTAADKRKAKRKAAADAARQARDDARAERVARAKKARDDARAERVSRARMAVREPLEAVDVDALLAPVPAQIQPAQALIQPAIPWAARKSRRPSALEWLSAPEPAPRHRNIDDWLQDDNQHQPYKVTD
jgi:hypothetical protein